MTIGRRWLLWALLLGGCPPPKPPEPIPTPSPARLRVGSWNLLHLGQHDKQLDLVTHVVNHFDVLALQEVMNPQGVQTLLASLGSGWRAVISEHPVGANGYFEQYAFLHRAEIDLLRAYTVDDPQDSFVREPFVGCFASAQFDFCMISIHVTFGAVVAPRDAEINALGTVVQGLRAQGGEKDWIVVGDFNRSGNAAGFDTLKSHGWSHTFAPDLDTSISKTGYASPFDHLLTDARFTAELLADPAPGRFDFVARVCGGDFAKCHKSVSDHAPVGATFTLTGADDD